MHSRFGIVQTFLIWLAVAVACSTGQQPNSGDQDTDAIATDSTSSLNLKLIDELAEMVELDQIAANIPQGKYKAYSEEDWQAFKKKTFETHHQRLETIFEEHGFTGYDLVGQEGADNFWLLTQHCDHAPKFQMRVLEKMKAEVEKANADAARYAFLVDRVSLNTGKEQVYGTQVSYNHEKCQAFARSLVEPETVNQRRKAMGLESLEDYLNGMSESHFEMNKENYRNQGITKPTLYPIQSID